MDQEDENYQLMLEHRTHYMDMVFAEAKKDAIPLTEFEVEEMETAFEHGFANGYVAALNRRKGRYFDS